MDFEKQCCPTPLLESKLWLKGAKAGEQLQLLLGDAGSRSDIPKYFQRLGHRVDINQESGGFLVTITVRLFKE